MRERIQGFVQRFVTMPADPTEQGATVPIKTISWEAGLKKKKYPENRIST